MNQFAVEPKHPGEEPVAQPHGALGDDVEDGLEVRRGAEITRRMSAVAVCCSSASFVSLNSRTFSIAITAWAAKVSRSSICLSENGWTTSRRITMETERHSFAQERRHESCPPAAMTRLDACPCLSVLGLGKRLEVDDVKRPPLIHCSTGDSGGCG